MPIHRDAHGSRRVIPATRRSNRCADAGADARTARIQQPAPAAGPAARRRCRNGEQHSSSATATAAQTASCSTGMGIAGIILGFPFFGYMRAGNDAGRPRA
jgi:hypothetical protein